MKTFGRDYPMASLYMLHGGDMKMYIDGITLIPIQHALQELPQLLGVGEGNGRCWFIQSPE